MRTIYSLLFITPMLAQYSFGMEQKECDTLAIKTKLIPAMMQEKNSLLDLMQQQPTQDPVELLIKGCWDNVPPHLKVMAPVVELFVMPVEIATQSIDKINKERYGKYPLDQRTADEIKKQLAKSRLGNKSKEIDLYRANPDQDSIFQSTLSKSMWVNEKKYKALSPDEQQQRILAEGNFIAWHGPAAKIIIPGALTLGATIWS